MSQRAGTIGLVSTGGLAGRLIRLGTLDHWNHAVIATGEGTLIEATPGGVVESPEDEYADIAWLTHEEFTDEQGAASVAYARGRLGVPYNWAAILVFVMATLLPWYPRNFFVRWAHRIRADICSELAVDAAHAGGRDWVDPNRLSVTVSPSTLDVAARRSGF